MAKHFALAVCGLALFAASHYASAVVVFSQSSDVTNGLFSDQDGAGSVIADDFVFGSNATISSVTWFGGYFPATTLPAADDFTVAFYTDAAGAPAVTSFASSAVGNAVNRTDTGVDYAFGLPPDHFQYTANITATALTAGTQYYISNHLHRERVFFPAYLPPRIVLKSPC